MTRWKTAPRRRPDTRGFTLIELMITLVVVAILSAVALPAFFDSIRKSRRSDAINAFATVQQAQERYRSSNTNYGTHFIVASGAFGGVGVSTDTNAATSYSSTGGYYSLALSGTSATAYTLLATAQGSQTNDSNCRFLRVQLSLGNLAYASGPTNSVGNSSAVNSACWRQ